MIGSEWALNEDCIGIEIVRSQLAQLIEETGKDIAFRQTNDFRIFRVQP